MQTYERNDPVNHASVNPTHDSAPVLSKDEARQGVTGNNVRYVLGYGLAGVVICFVIVAILAMTGVI